MQGIGEGILRFHGWLHELEPLLHSHPETAQADKRPEWFGVALDKADGHCNGSLKHGNYFECDDNHGIFVPAGSNTIELVEGR